MNKKSRLLAVRIIGWGLMALAVFVSLAVRFSNPQMTETQLLINFFPVWVFVGINVLVGTILVSK